LSIIAPGPAAGTGTNPGTPAVLEEFTVLEDTQGRALSTLAQSAQTQTYTYTFAGDLGFGGGTGLEIRMRPTLASPLSWLAVALGKQYKLGVDSVELKSIDQQQESGIKFCPVGGRTRSLVNLADPKSQLVLTTTACAQNIEPIIMETLPLPIH
jgi:hypothetical protein